MDLDDEIRYHLLRNATRHDGVAMPKAVLGAILGAHPELRGMAGDVLGMAEEAAAAVNAMSPAEQASALSTYGIAEERAAPPKGLPPLTDTAGREWEGEVGMRFAPGPSGPLHLGHTRALILNDEYVRRYGGRMVLRFEDTNPAKLMPEAYDMIREDVEWLGVRVHEVVVQSDRMGIYYDHARDLLGSGASYVCTCPVEEWRAGKEAGRACPHRDADGTDDWRRMLDGEFAAGEASLVVKTDLDHPNPAVRDFVAFRIVDEPHPRTGDRYRVYPTYNFAVAVDDHLTGMTHVLRGKDHLNNTLRQKYVYRHFGWEEPVFHHYGWVKIEETILKKSTIGEAIRTGEFDGWDDVRLGTLRAMRARGIQPQAIRGVWRENGTNPVDIVFSWENLMAFNKQAVNDSAGRLFFVADPVHLTVRTECPLKLRAPVHPDHPERGYREYTLRPADGTAAVLVPSAELPASGVIRLKDLCNITLDAAAQPSVPGRSAAYTDNDPSVLRRGVSIVQAVPAGHALPCTVRMPDGTAVEGVVEDQVRRLEPPVVVQFERFGFVNVVGNDGHVLANFAHK